MRFGQFAPRQHNFRIGGDTTLIRQHAEEGRFSKLWSCYMPRTCSGAGEKSCSTQSYSSSLFQRVLHSISLRVHSWSAGSQESSGLKSVIAVARFVVSAPRSF